MLAMDVALLRTIDHPDRLDEIAALLTEGFLNNPLYVYVYGEDVASRRRGLAYLNKRRVQLMGERSTFWMGQDGSVQGHVCLMSADSPPPTLFQMVQVCRSWIWMGHRF